MNLNLRWVEVHTRDNSIQKYLTEITCFVLICFLSSLLFDVVLFRFFPIAFLSPHMHIFALPFAIVIVVINSNTTTITTIISFFLTKQSCRCTLSNLFSSIYSVREDHCTGDCGKGSNSVVGERVCYT